MTSDEAGFRDLTAHHVTALLRENPETGAHWSYFTRFGRTNEYVLFRIPEGTTRRERVASVAVDRPAYMHSFALAPDHAVLVESPLVTHPVKFLRPGQGGFIDNDDWKPGRGTRFHVFRRDDGGDPTFARLASAVEMPRFSPEVHTRPYEYVFAQSTERDDGNDLVRVDVETGETRRWAEADVLSGEPVFVPRPDSDEEADGVVLSLCLDGEMAELARAEPPHAVPFGFHGAFFPA